MILTFDRALVERLIAHAKAAPNHNPTYGQKPPIAAGLWLVGDDGVYLMSNGEPRLTADSLSGPGWTAGGEKSVVAYARECDPTTMAFDDWWAAKRASFGGDDGSDFLAVTDFEAALKTYPPRQPLKLDVTAQAIGIVTYKIKGKRRK